MVPSASRARQAWSRELQCVATAQCCPRGNRAISTNSAIARGLRETSTLDRRYSGEKRRPLFRKELEEYDRRRDPVYKAKKHAEFLEKRRLEMGIAPGKELDPDGVARFQEWQMGRKPEREGNNDLVAIPYTTAASKFLYGVSAVRAALIARRRKFYKLYIHDRAIRRSQFAGREDRNNTEHARESKEEISETLVDLAANIPGLEVKMVTDSFLSVMDKMSNNRPHNGVILEASPLAVLPITNLRPCIRTRPSFSFELDRQSPEEKRINGTNNQLPYNSHGWRFPLLLYLDSIVDEGNLGAIIRSAYYFGVDAILVSTRGTAPLDAIAIKASSGAAEAIPILSVANPLSFLTRSGLNGWRVYAADAPPPPRDNFNVTSDYAARALDPPNTSPLVSFIRPTTLAVLRDHSPLLEHPTILMLGGESAGFRRSIRDKANYLVGVRGTRGLDIGVDSLNVSVAAALIMLELLRKPKMAERLNGDAERRVRARRADNRAKENIDDMVNNDEMLF
ncbi:rna family [Diplodia corticola]|uniref:rRNA methyltransferase 1, mitochondrial n=1 Tax=Diplodia corticola TaxID=236234 RepID=A0A1J9R1F1_9PEZI|nr:rna family [Diplodia corticola]OJD34066.1 rna family [Diplodia corticola]